MSNIPLVDLRSQWDEVKDEVELGWQDVLENTSYILGPAVAKFEKEYADFSGQAYCVGVANGTDAIELALRASGVESGKEVIIPANTFIATALAVVRIGAKPVLVDVDDKHMLISVEAVEKAITKQTAAIIPVHLFGQMADIESIKKLADAHSLVVVEDAAQSQGASRNGKPVGSLSAAAATSFYPGKNLGAAGDAGGITTNDSELAAKIKALRNYGSEQKYYHPELGFNSRLDSLQAVVLSAKLRKLADWNEKRRQAAAYYHELLSGAVGITLPEEADGNYHVWHLYPIRIEDRDRVMAEMQTAGIGVGVHYPVPIHLQKSFEYVGAKKGDFPVTEKAADSMLSLPMFPHITRKQQDRVVEALQKAMKGSS